uniref:C2H2-type domain-containing protein n=1 Tax=Nothobranchius furzeri TaxID=105023 RepID=A0A8C6LPK3_NOTFU
CGPWSLQIHLRVMGHSEISSSDGLVNKKFDGVKAHSGQKPFVCELCGQRFSDKTYLTRHMNVHTEHKPFACGHCGKRFSRRSYLTSHVKVHTGHKPFACGHCGKRFYKRSYLNSHTRVHTGQNSTLHPQLSGSNAETSAHVAERPPLSADVLLVPR